MIKKLFKKQISFFSILSIAILAMFFVISPNTANAGSITLPPNNLGLVGYWSFEDATGTITTDYSGNGNTGTLTNMTNDDWVDGKIGKALDFDGADDYVPVPYKTSLDLYNTDFTFSSWYYYVSGGSGIIFSNRDLAECNGYDKFFQFNTSGVTLLDGNYPSHYKTIGDIGGTVVERWTNVAVTKQGSTFSIYVNGELKNSDTYTYDFTDNNPLVFARSGNVGCAPTFSGKIDDTRLFNRALSATEISTLYNQSKTTRIKTGVSNEGLVGYWSFEDAIGTVATDFSGNGNTGTLTNMTNDDWVDGKKGKALDFDGVDDYVDVGDILDPTFTGNSASFTISAWVLFNDVSEGSRDNIVSKIGDSVVGANQRQFIFRKKDDKLDFILYEYLDQSDGTYSGVGNTNLNTGSWYHVALVVNIIGDGVDLYLNGLTESFSATGGVVDSIEDGTYPLEIGSRNGGVTGNINGQIDDVRIYSRALSANEVSNLYNQSKTTYINTSQNNKLTDGLVGLWSFNGQDLDGTTAFDRSGSGNDGTLTNGPQPAAGKIGQALSFDGSDDYVSIADDDILSFGNGVDDSPFSLSSWVKPSDLSTAQTVLSKTGNPLGESSFGYTEYDFWLLDTTGYPHLVLRGPTAADYVYRDGSSLSCEINNWCHIVATYSGVGGVSGITFYVNGVQEVSYTSGSSGSYVALDNMAGPMTIGAMYLSSSIQYFSSLNIDEVRIYNRVLTTNEIKQLYSQGR